MTMEKKVLSFTQFIAEKKKCKESCLSEEEKKKALEWYKDGIDLQTIADHFELSVDEIKKELNRGV